MTLKTLAAAVCLSMATATTGFAATINLDFEFDGVAGTFFGLDDADGVSSASSFTLFSGPDFFTVDVSAQSINNLFDFSAGDLISAVFITPGVVLGNGFESLSNLSIIFERDNGVNFGSVERPGTALDAQGPISFQIAPVSPVSAVPLPAGGLLLLSGLGGIAAFKRRKKRAA